MGTELESNKEDATLKINKRFVILSKIKHWGKVVVAITSIAAAVAASWQGRSQAQEAKQGASDGYKTLAPALSAVQRDLSEGMATLASVAKATTDLQAQRERDQEAQSFLRERVARCETYIEIISRGRYKPADEPAERPVDDVVAALTKEASKAKAMIPQLKAEALANRKAKPVPQSLMQAQSYQKNMVK